jgi:hypothetical protein
MKRSVVEGPKFKKQFKKVSQYKNFKKQKFIEAVTMLKMEKHYQRIMMIILLPKILQQSYRV